MSGERVRLGGDSFPGRPDRLVLAVTGSFLMLAGILIAVRLLAALLSGHLAGAGVAAALVTGIGAYLRRLEHDFTHPGIVAGGLRAGDRRTRRH
jgi:hypothetical protein